MPWNNKMMGISDKIWASMTRIRREAAATMWAAQCVDMEPSEFACLSNEEQQQRLRDANDADCMYPLVEPSSVACTSSRYMGYLNDIAHVTGLTPCEFNAMCISERFDAVTEGCESLYGMSIDAYRTRTESDVRAFIRKAAAHHV